MWVDYSLCVEQKKMFKISVLKRIAIKFLDYGYSLVIITPLLILFWYSTWNIFDQLLNSTQYNKLISFAIGVCGQFFMLFHHDALRRILNVKNSIASACLSRFYVLICGIVNICFWRLVWISYDVISSNDDNSIVLNLIQTGAILMALRAFVNSIFIPFVVATDECEENVPEYVTYRRKSVSCKFL